MDDVLVRPRERARSRFPTVNVALFLATLGTTLLLSGFPFAAALLAILVTHEMGHYVVARRYGVDATLPYFIPIPFGVGTLGAVIRMRSAFPSRRAALEIGAAGPIAGLVVAVPLLAWGVAHGQIGTIDESVSTFARSPLEALLLAWNGREAFALAPDAQAVFGESLVVKLVTWAVAGPLPDGATVFIHPVGFAAWIGLLVTTLNLVPIGQLDGGHVLYALLGGPRARVAGTVLSWSLLFVGLAVSWTWLVWWALTRFLVGVGHPPARTEEPLSPASRLLAVVSLALFVLTFVPVPVSF